MILVTFRKIGLSFSVYNISKNYTYMVHGQISTKYADMGFFRHPCPTLIQTDFKEFLGFFKDFEATIIKFLEIPL